MSSLALWSEEKQRNFGEELTGYWAQDIWDLHFCPANTQKGYLGRSRFLKFECPSPNVNTELKYLCWKKFIQGDWKVRQERQSQLNNLMNWMKSCLPTTTRSLLERDLHEWEMSYCSFRVAKGDTVHQKAKYLTASQRFKEITIAHPHISLLRHLYHELEKIYDTRSEYEKDVWDFRQLGVRVNPAHGNYKANFSSIHQPWLKQLAKTLIRYRLTVYSVSDCHNKLKTLNSFSDFLAKYHPTAGPCNMTRNLMIEYFGFLAAKGISPTVRGNYITNLRTMLEFSAREGLDDLPQSRIIYDEDMPRRVQPIPRYIPDQVLEQIFLHLNQLETRWQRMFVVAFEVGMRVSELLNLPFNCLMQDAMGDWWIKYYQEKLKQEHTQPISKETAAMIQIQQQEIQKRFSDQTQLLFPNPKGETISYAAFTDAINKFIIEHNIRDTSGVLWRFQPHQLRHCFGTRHINSGTPHLIVMRLMGHRNPLMTTRYAHIHDTTLKQEYERSLGKRKLIDISGRVIMQNSPADASDLQWLKRQMDARTLPNGYCGIPLALGPCPHPNSCLTCPHFRTDKTHLPTHENQLAETIKLVQIAHSKGWITQAENNERIARNLKTMIASLKEKDDDSQTQC